MKKIRNIKINWDLKPLYGSLDDKQINTDIAAIELIVTEFRDKYYDRKDYLRRADLLRDALRDDVRIKNILSAPKFLIYLYLKADLEPDNEKIIALLAKYCGRYLEAWNKVEFFNHAVRGIPKKRQERFLKTKTLSKYRRLLEAKFNDLNKRRNLSCEAEEMDTLSMMSTYIWWVWMGEELRKKLVIHHNGKEISFGEAKAILPSLSPADRIDVHNQINSEQKKIGLAATFELNAMISHQKTMDNKRKYPRPFSSTLHGDEMNDRVVQRLADTVIKSYSISHRFYELHAKLLGMEKIGLCDIDASFGSISSLDFKFENMVPVIWQAFKAFDPRCADWFESYLKNGQIDVYPKKGKPAGAYCMYGNKSFPIYIFMNYADSLDSVVTVAHECGHAFHCELSKHVRMSLFRDHSTALAETASMFFEKMMFERLFKTLSPQDKIVALHGRLMNDMNAIFRQIAFFNYEVELHRLIRKKGAALESQMVGLMAKHLQSYLGPAVQISQDDGYLFATRPHLRDFFYHYTYAFGDLVSGELFDRWKKDKSYTAKIINLLSAGSSHWVDDLLKDNVGININDPDFFAVRLAKISARIDELEKLINETKK